MSKEAKKYSCEVCDFSCTRKNNYDKHLTTRKHKNLTNPNKKEEKKHICECGKIYKHAPTLSHHKKTCKYLNDVVELKQPEVSENDKLAEKDKIIEHLLKDHKEMKDLMTETIKTIQNQPATTTNIVNNFNLNVYLNDTCKDALNLTDFVDSIQLQLKNLEDMGKVGYVEGMSNLIITELNNLEKDKRPIHCSDAKRDVLYIKDNDTWEKDNSKVEKVVKDLEKNNYNQLSKWLEQNPSAKIPHTEKADEFHKILVGANSNIDQEKKIKKVLKNIARATPVRETNNID
jgi:hypothetical protein